jgi:hypothetical protein
MITSTSAVSPIMPGPQLLNTVFPPVIQIYSFAPDPLYHINPVQPLDVDYMDDTTARPVLVTQLELPRFAPDVMISAFDIRPDPAFPARTSSTPSVRTDKPFTQDPGKGLVVFDIHVMEPPDEVNQQPPGSAFELFVLRETLIKYAEEGEGRLRVVREENRSEGNQPWRLEVMLPWEQWGVKDTRMMDLSMHRRQWVCDVHFSHSTSN